MFKPKKISGTKYPLGILKNKRGTGVYGEVELYRHYHHYSSEMDKHEIVVYGFAYARNGTKLKVNADVLFRHSEFNAAGEDVWKKEDPPENMPSPYKRKLSPGDTYSRYGSSSISYELEGYIGKDQRINLDAHIHMVVAGHVWHTAGEEWRHTFTNEYNMPIND